MKYAINVEIESNVNSDQKNTTEWLGKKSCIKKNNSAIVSCEYKNCQHSFNYNSKKNNGLTGYLVHLYRHHIGIPVEVQNAIDQGKKSKDCLTKSTQCPYSCEKKTITASIGKFNTTVLQHCIATDTHNKTMRTKAKKYLQSYNEK